MYWLKVREFDREYCLDDKDTCDVLETLVDVDTYFQRDELIRRGKLNPLALSKIYSSILQVIK